MNRLALILLLAAQHVLAQPLALKAFQNNYTSIPVLDTIPPAIQKSLKLKYEKIKIDDQSGKVRSLAAKLTRESNNRVVSLFNQGYLMTEGEITSYLESILKVIRDANPEIPRDFNIYGYRSEEPNAVSFEDGTIGIMLGLLSRMKSEDEVAFVICHEVAHYTQRHLENSILQFARLNYDQDLAQRISDIKGGEYERYTKLKKLLTDMGLSLNRHSRKHEFEADSVGYLYFRKTNYAKASAISLLQLLDSADKPVYTKLLDLKKSFNFTDYPFKESWLTYSRSSIPHRNPRADDDYGMSDTTHTHPDCKRRIVALKRIGGRLGDDSDQKLSDKKMDTTQLYIGAQSSFEIIESTYYFKKYGKSLFETLILLEQYPQNIYLKSMCARNLYKLYQSQKNHQFGKYVSVQNSFYPENYDRFLSFLHDLRLQDLASLGYYTIVTQPERFFEDQEFLFAFWLVSDTPRSKFSPTSIKETYLEEFPGAIHTKEIKYGIR